MKGLSSESARHYMETPCVGWKSWTAPLRDLGRAFAVAVSRSVLRGIPVCPNVGASFGLTASGSMAASSD